VTSPRCGNGWRRCCGAAREPGPTRGGSAARPTRGPRCAGWRRTSV
jgi:hypothetical protein